MSCRSTPGSSACVSIAAVRSGLDERQVSAVLHAAIREASTHGLGASREAYVKRLESYRRQIERNPEELGAARSANVLGRLARGVAEDAIEDPARRYAVASVEERCLLARSHLTGVLERASMRIGENYEPTVRRYHAYRAEAELDRSCRAPEEFKGKLADGAFTWATPRDRITAWALYRLAQDAGDEPSSADLVGPRGGDLGERRWAEEDLDD